MKSALKIRLYPNTEQQNKLSVQFGCARWVWNNALNFAQNHYQQTGETLSTYDLNARLKPLKIEHQWLKEADSQVLQQSILNFGEARQRFFKKQAHFPKYKAKHKRQSIQYPQRVKFNEEQRSLYLPKIGWVRCVLHRELIGQVKTVTISKTPSGELIEKLRYKLARKGGHLVVVERFFPSSKLCSVCNYKHDDLSLSVRQWNCPACGTHHDRDINAAINLKKEGIRLLVLQKCFVRIASGSGDKHLTAAGLTVAACGGLCQTSQEAAA